MSYAFVVPDIRRSESVEDRQDSVRDGSTLSEEPPTWHHIRSTCKAEGVSARKVARRWKISLKEVRRQLNESTDLRLSELHRWQALLRVPFAELLPANAELALANPVSRRSQLIKAMKTVMSIQDAARQVSVQRLVSALIDQLTVIMPELAEVERWHGTEIGRGLYDDDRVARLNLSEIVAHGVNSF